MTILYDGRSSVMHHLIGAMLAAGAKILSSTDANGEFYSDQKASIKKVYRLFEELRVHPYEGTGKPKPLMGDYAGYWSRSINPKDRLIYRVRD